jgi:hypothetical protein
MVVSQDVCLEGYNTVRRRLTNVVFWPN